MAVPAALAQAAVDLARAGRRHRHRLHRLHDGADHGRRHPALRAAGVRRRAARLRQALAPPRRAGPGGPDQRAGPRAGRGLAGPLRRPDLLGVGVRQGPAAARGGARGLRRRWRTSSRPPTGSSGSCAARYVRNACTAGYKGIYQDGTYPSRDFLAALNPDFADFVADKLDQPIGQLGDRAGVADREAAALDRPARGHRGRGRQRRRPRHRARGAGRRARPAGRDHGHLDLPRDERRRAARGPGHVRRRRRRHHAAACGATRPGRAASATSSAGSSPTRSRPSTPRRPRDRGIASTSTSPSSPRSRRSASTVWSPSTGTAATARCWSTTTCPAWSSGQTLATRPEDVYRALLEATAFGTRTIVEAFDEAGVPVNELVVAGGLLKNPLLMQIYADVTDLPLSTIGSAQGPALGSAIHAAVAAGAYPDIARRRRGDGPRWTAGATARSRRTSRPTTSCTTSTARCTTTSAAAPTRSCTGSRPVAEAGATA